MKYRFSHITLIVILLLQSSCKLVRTIGYLKKGTTVNIMKGQPDYVSLPVQYKKGKLHLAVPCGKNSNDTASLMLDTGAPTVFTEDFAKKHRYTIYGRSLMRGSTETGSGVSRDTKGKLIKHFYMSLGGARVYKKQTVVRQLNAERFTCDHNDGLLGADVLSKFGMYTDMKNNRLILFKAGYVPDSIKAFPYHFTFKASLFQHTPVFKMQLFGKENKVIWDMGFNGSLMIQYENDSKGEMQEVLKTMPGVQQYETYGTIADINGVDTTKVDMYCSEPDSIGNEGKAIPFFNTVFVKYNGRMDMKRANIGTNWMEHYRFFIDWKHKMIYLSPFERAAEDLRNEIPLACVWLQAREEVVVAKINVTSVAYKSGIRAGDVVKSMNDMELKGMMKNTDACERQKVLLKMYSEMKSIETVRKGELQRFEVGK